MQIDLDNIAVENNEERNRFEVLIAGHLAVIDYRRRGNEIIYTHTGVPDELGGQGIASKMAKTALEYARAESLYVVPQCPFIRAYIRRHPEYKDLVSKDFGEL